MSRWSVYLTSVLAVSTSGTAIADRIGPASSDTREAQLLTEVEPLTRAELGLRWRADLVGAALTTTGDGERATTALAAADAEVAITSGSTCDLIMAGGRVIARRVERVLSFEQRASVCPLGGDGHIAFDHRLEWDVAPRLLAAPRLRPGLQRRETIGFDFFGSTVQTNDPGPLSLAPPPPDLEQGGQARMEIQVGWQEGEGRNEVRALMDVVMRNFRREYGDDQPPLALAAVTARLEVLAPPGPTDEGTAVSLSGDLGRLEGLRVGNGVRIGGRLGARFIGLTRGREMTYQQNLVLVAEAGASVERDLARGLTLRLAGDRQGWPAWDGRFVIDDRATLSLAARRGRARAHLDLSAAATHVLEVGTRVDIATGGISAEAQLPLGSYLTLKVRTEAGRSVYAAGAAFDAPIWASETMLLLATHADQQRDWRR